MQWLRWYRGTVEDAKFRFIAKTVGCSISDVIATWAVLLEDAACDDHRGVVTRDEDWIATILDFDDGLAERILACMQDTNMIVVGATNITICNWDARQFESDRDKTAAERQKRRREKLRADHAPVTRDARVSHGRVTVPETDTETDTEKKRVEAAQARPKAQRWPSDAIVPEDWIEDGHNARARNSLPAMDLGLEAQSFANYWASKSGKDATKLDWKRTWLNWCLNAKGKSHGSAKPTQLEQLASIARADTVFDE